MQKSRKQRRASLIFFETVTSGNVPIPDVTDLFDHIVSVAITDGGLARPRDFAAL
jgi:hypothetical protein